MLPGLIAHDQEFQQDQCEQDGEGIVDAGFHLKRGSDARAQPQAASMDEEEDRCGVGGGKQRTDQQSFRPVEAEQQHHRRSGDHSRQKHTDRSQYGRRPQHAAEGIEPCPQSAVEQDQCQADGADDIERAHIVELDPAWPGFTRQQSEEQEDQEQGCAKA